jgi:hypothetical protein
MAAGSSNLAAAKEKPQKGVIYIQTQKFMSCRD